MSEMTKDSLDCIDCNGNGLRFGDITTHLKCRRCQGSGIDPFAAAERLKEALACLTGVVESRFTGLEIVALVPGELREAVNAAKAALAATSVPPLAHGRPAEVADGQ